MPKYPVNGKYFEYRNGLGGFAWEGMATKVDPGGTPPNRPRVLRNIRIQGGQIISRPKFHGPGAIIPAKPNVGFNFSLGQPVIPALWDRPYGPVYGMTSWSPHWTGEHNSVAGLRLWFGGAPPLSYNPNTQVYTVNPGGFVGYVDTDSDPWVNTVAIYNTQDAWGPCIEKYNNEVYIGDYGSLRKSYLVLPPPGFEPAAVLSVPSDEVIVSFPGFRVSQMLEHEGKLYFVLSDPTGATNGFIYSWDGFVATEELALTNPADSGAAIAVYKDTLVVSLSGYSQIQVRSATGVWTQFTTGGFDCSPFGNSMVQYGDLLYIMGGDDKIWTWNGSVILLGHTIAVPDKHGPGNDADPAYAFSCAVLNGRLYYAWSDLWIYNNEPLPADKRVQIVLGYVDMDNDALYRYVDDGCSNNSLSTDTADGHGGEISRKGGNALGAATAMAQYRGRLWIAAGAYPTGNSILYTHRVQYSPWDGWHEADGDNGPGYFWTGLGGSEAPQIFYMRTI